MQQYTVTGMHCAACSASVEKAVKKVPGVTSCAVSLLTNSMGVEGTASPEAVIKAVQDAGGELSDKKFTEYSRVILALTAIGKDPADVGGYDLLAKLADMDKVTYQGLNGAIFALIALDSAGYEVPAAAEDANQTSREALVAYILDKQLSDGGWALSGDSADPVGTELNLL